MAVYHCRIKVHSRGKGAKAASASAYRSGTRVTGRSTNAVRAAAYRAGSTLTDPAGEVHDFTRKHGIVWNGILAPKGAPAWVYDRGQLWAAVEKAEKRKDAQLFREAELTIPRELSPAQRVSLVRSFVQEQFVSQGMIADIGIHCPRASDGGEQPHAHVMLSLRSIGPDGFGKKNRDWNGAHFARKEGKPLAVNAIDGGLLKSTREAWQDACNKALSDAGSTARVDHRSLKAQGKDHHRLPHQGESVHVREPKDGYARKREDLGRAYFERRAREAVQAVLRVAKQATPPRPPALRPPDETDPHHERVARMRYAVQEVTRLNGARLARDGMAWAAQLAAELHGTPPEPSPPEQGVGHER